MPKSGIDRRVVEGHDALHVAVVDGIEQRLGGAAALGLQAEQARDGGAGGGRVVEHEDVVEVADQAPLGLWVVEPHRVAALEAVLALLSTSRRRPSGGILVGRAQADGAVGQRRLGCDAALGVTTEKAARKQSTTTRPARLARTIQTIHRVEMGRATAAALLSIGASTLFSTVDPRAQAGCRSAARYRGSCG